MACRLSSLPLRAVHIGFKRAALRGAVSVCFPGQAHTRQARARHITLVGWRPLPMTRTPAAWARRPQRPRPLEPIPGSRRAARRPPAATRPLPRDRWAASVATRMHELPRGPITASLVASLKKSRATFCSTALPAERRLHARHAATASRGPPSDRRHSPPSPAHLCHRSCPTSAACMSQYKRFM
jgi:hypothetical protein